MTPFKAPDMPPLPAFRISRTETVFTNIGVDVFGPFKVEVVNKEGVTKKTLGHCIHVSGRTSNKFRNFKA